jgi:CRISPR/Cas system-associated exonuclease Cas4 (RecB family)
MVEGPLDPLEALDAALQAKGLRKVAKWAGRRPPLRFRASEAGKCARQVWYRLSGFKPAAPSAFIQYIWDQGNSDQDLIRNQFRGNGIPVYGIEFTDTEQLETLDVRTKFQVPLGDKTVEITVAARADGKLDTPQGPALFEFKTVRNRAMYWMQKAYDGYWKAMGKGNKAIVAYIKKKKRQNYYQVQATMAALKEKLTIYVAKDKDRTTYGMVTKEGKPVGVYIDYDEKVVDEVLTMFAAVSERVKSGEPPDPEYYEGSYECNYCDFKEHCPTMSGIKGMME